MILLIDNYDSFSYNLYQYLGELERNIHVMRNDAIDARGVRELAPTHIVISPGPGKPADAGNCEAIIRELAETAGSVPILGVCLGHQAICEVFGARVDHARELKHGKQSLVTLEGASPLFTGLPDQIEVARYHSLAADSDTIPECLQITARAPDGEVMAVQHIAAPIFGVQFHPESIMTPHGKRILANFLNL